MNVKPRILICDDDETLVKDLERFFERDYDVTAVFSVQDSIKALARDGELDEGDRFAVVIVDLEFRDRRTGTVIKDAGFKILEKARNDQFLEPIVYTGRGNEKSAYKAISEGAFRYIPKSTTRRGVDKNLADTVKKAIELRASLLELTSELDQLTTAGPHAQVVQKLAQRVIRYVLQIRGRSE